MINDSIKLAKLWMQLHEIKEKLDNEVIPVSSYLGITDAELMNTSAESSLKIEEYFVKFKLITVINRES